MLAAPGVWAAGVAELAQRFVQAGLDPEECYRIRELNFAKEDLRFYLTDGYLIFGKAVDGVRTAAVFSADVEGGDAEVLLFPPNRSERQSLANYIGTPNMSEHFKSAVFVFTDDSFARLSAEVRARETNKKSPEQGVLLAQSWQPVVRNMASSFQIRLVGDFLAGHRPQQGWFYAALGGGKLGNFDLLYDPRADEQITVGQVTTKEGRTYFDIWTRFPARSFRSRPREAPVPDASVSNFRSDAIIEPDLKLRVKTTLRLVADAEDRRAATFYISRQMKVTEALIDGEPAEVFQPESLRANLIRGGSNDAFLVVPAKELVPGRAYEVEFRHEGAVISDAGNGVYFVGARGSWYPSRGLHFSRYDLTFRYPKQLDLVATGQVVDDVTEGDWRVARRRADGRIRVAGFNLGNYERRAITRGGYTIEVYANRRVEKALEPKPQRLVLLPAPRAVNPTGQRRPLEVLTVPMETPHLDPTQRLERLAGEVAAGLEFMSGLFGAPPLRNLTVSPIPGTFGQGFPGLVYLSTISYLAPEERPAAARGEYHETFFSEILSAHETAHQWWGNVVTTAAYQDEWLMEALANYSALLLLEKRKGTRALESMLADYKTHLLAKTEEGRITESAGPIVWGLRLESSQVPAAWRTIVYGKGSWIMHMLRRQMGDQRFLDMLGELRRRYQYRAVTTEQFRRLAAQFLPPRSPDPQLEEFFEQWVYATGIPSLRINYSVRGKAPNVRITGTLTQRDAGADFSAWVPIEVQYAKGRPIVHWVRSADGAVPFELTVRQAPGKVVLDPGNSVLRR